MFLAAIPPTNRTDRLMSDGSLQETCRVIGSHVYVDYVCGYHGTGRAPYFTCALGVEGTERNWRTVLALSTPARESTPDRTSGKTT
jgi:uncharacterized protein (DUF1697 family)